ncbi:MAG: TatD family hydrolase [Candidatus Nanoarchaeia archaeon]
MFIDLHCHIDFYEDELDKVVGNAKNAGVSIIVGSGICPESNRKLLEFQKKHPIIRPSLGIYPWDALEFEKQGKLDFNIEEEIEFIRNNSDKITGVGEIGLDYKNGQENNGQRKQFRKMLELAKEIDKPVIIHSRKAEKDAIEILEEKRMKKVVMHCFSGKKSLLKRARDNGWYFTVPTSVVRAQQYQLLVEEVNITRLFCETDSPFMSPFKEKWNEPAFVVEAYKEVARIKGLGLEETRNNIFKNWQDLFE